MATAKLPPLPFGTLEHMHAPLIWLHEALSPYFRCILVVPVTPTRPISQITVAQMIGVFEYLCEVRGWGSHRYAWLDLQKLPTILFGMGFQRSEITKFESTYYWHFASLLPAIYDGSFFGPAYRGTDAGQNLLKGFATLLCWILSERPEIPVEDQGFRQSLLSDGYKFVDGHLVLTEEVDTTPPELLKLPNKKKLVQDVRSYLDNRQLVSVLFIDLDNFKSVNDKLGHAEGDKCLIKVVDVISSAIVFKGKLYRVGGDEFCVLLLNFSGAEAVVTAQRIRAGVDVLPAFGGRVKVTTSIGVADSSTEGLSSPEALVDAADAAMYKAKHATKNSVAVHAA